MIRCFEYNLPFAAPFTTAADHYSNRKGILIEHKNGSENIIVEASPLPGFSLESFSNVKNALDSHHKKIEVFFDREFTTEGLKQFSATLPRLPALQFAISFLGLSILSKRHSISIHQLLKTPKSYKVRINEIIGAGDVQHIQKKIEQGTKNGFTTFKIKAPWPTDPLIEALKNVLPGYPGITLRLDANQTWPEEKLEHIGNDLKSLPIEYVEEPVAIRNLEIIKRLRSRLSVPIAVDDSIKRIPELKQVLATEYGVYIIIKPMVLGNLFDIIETISAHRSTFKKVVVTTSLESFVGRSMTNSVASIIGDPQLAHGLHTGQFFDTDLVDNQTKPKGFLDISDGFHDKQMSDLKTSLIEPLH